MEAFGGRVERAGKRGGGEAHDKMQSVVSACRSGWWMEERKVEATWISHFSGAVVV